MEVEDCLDPQDVERAKTFWAEEDVDQVFTGVSEYLDHLRRVLKEDTATDQEYVQGLKLLQCLDLSPLASSQDSSVVQVVVGSGELPPSKASSSSAPPPAGTGELLPPLTPIQLQYQPHPCSKACLPTLPSMPQSTPAFWAQNPLKVPLLCGFKRLSAVPPTSSRRCGKGAGPALSEDEQEPDVIYKTPCGLSLRNHDDVMRFLLATKSYSVLQVDFFTFNPSVRLDPPPLAGPRQPEVDLSRGVEPTPVELCAGDGGVRLAEFRYRKDRWPHGCFLSRGPTLFSTCCDCSDGCSDAQRCACVALTRGGRHYSHHRLYRPVPSGVYECGPWCGCDRARCLNRLVQRGIRVRLQVFQTEGHGWGVRCRDDLDRGTFVCMYAGVILQRARSPRELPPPKLTRADLPSDDDVQIVTEWPAPPVLEGQSNLPKPPTASSPHLHVPVIQRPADTSAAAPQVQSGSVGGPEPPSPSTGGSGDRPPAQEKKVAMTTASPEAAAAARSANGTETDAKSRRRLKRPMKVEDFNFLDASKEGNVSRFINHSCQPNLFIQSVFTDSHDPAFPVIAFFTSRVVRAGTELTWNYSADTQRKRLLPGLVCQRGQPV